MSSIHPDFEYDIFISYRQNDNKRDKWVTQFVEALKDELEATLKNPLSIYFDENPHDGLLELHDVDRSLAKKLKCLIFIPIISQTYCDPNCFAWQHELLVFNKLAKDDLFGRNINLKNGNVESRILPVKIHDLEQEDITLLENELGGVLRAIEFIFKSSGVNRPLGSFEDHIDDNLNHTYYNDQINKVANAIKDIIYGVKNTTATSLKPVGEKLKEIPPSKIENKSQKLTLDEVRKNKRSYKKFVLGVSSVLLAILAFYFISSWYKQQNARMEILPLIQTIADESFRTPTRAFDLAIEADNYIPNDSTLINLWPKISTVVDITTEPDGVEVFWKDYDKPDAEWRGAGTTPMKEVRFPQGYLRMEFRKSGYQTISFAGPRHPFKILGTDIAIVKLDKEGELPEDMVRIPTGSTSMLIVGLEQEGPMDVPEFLMDQFEVTNEEYKIFIDADGYTNRDYWKNAVIYNGNEIDLDSAFELFIDRTGRQGPSTWEAGTYLTDTESHPVTGVSWYEAAAYAAYAKKQLPSIYHWARVAATGRSEFIIPLSNYNGSNTIPVGSLEGYSSFGIYDLAGNAREWCNNESNDFGYNYILGGGWDDPIYSFNDSYTQPGIGRSKTNGFRCIIELAGDSSINQLNEPVFSAFRDYRKESPVDDHTFEIIKRQYDYDKSLLNAVIDSTFEWEGWQVEKITFDAAYNNERMQAYFYTPVNSSAPYQTILFFTGSGAIHSRKFNPNRISHIDFILKSGRAIIIPIFKGTYERFDELNSDLQEETVFYKDHVIMWRKDIGRTLDYLETRDDVDKNKFGFLGWSWGGFMGGIMPAVEPRFKAIVLNVGGMEMTKALPEADQLNFLPRVVDPVLMLNGEYDMFFPLETSQKPMFDFLGTPDEHKKMIVYKTGHLVPRTEFVKETLFWFDNYLGRAK